MGSGQADPKKGPASADPNLAIPSSGKQLLQHNLEINPDSKNDTEPFVIRAVQQNNFIEIMEENS